LDVAQRRLRRKEVHHLGVEEKWGWGGERKGDKVCQGYLLMEDYGTVYGSRGSYVHHTADSKQKSLKLCLLLD